MIRPLRILKAIIEYPIGDKDMARRSATGLSSYGSSQSTLSRPEASIPSRNFQQGEN